MTTPPPDRTAPAGTSSLPLALIDKPYPAAGGQRDLRRAAAGRRALVRRLPRRLERPLERQLERHLRRHPAAPGRAHHHARRRRRRRLRRQEPVPAPRQDAGRDARGLLRLLAPVAAGAPPRAGGDAARQPVRRRHRALRRGPPAIARVERLPLAGGKSLDQVALRVTLRRRPRGRGAGRPGQPGRDRAALRRRRFATADGRYALEGRLGLACRRGEVEQAYLVAGTSSSTAIAPPPCPRASTPAPSASWYPPAATAAGPKPSSPTPRCPRAPPCGAASWR